MGQEQGRGRGSLFDKQGQGQGPARAAKAGQGKAGQGKAGRLGQTPTRCFQLQTGQWQGQGTTARANTRPLFSITDRARARAGQGGQGRHPPAIFNYTCIYI